MTTIAFLSAFLLYAPPQQLHGGDPAESVHTCPVEPDGFGLRGGGMNGFGWDGIGNNAVTVYWHIEGGTTDLGVGQRQAIIDALQAYADVVQITFEERAFDNRNVAIDFHFLTGDHCTSEPAECGNPNCAFDGPGGTIAHAGFPPLALSSCPTILSETYAGNVHFDDAETWEQDAEGPAGAISLTLTAAHEIGHALGLVHSSGVSDVMYFQIGSNDTFNGLTAADIANIRSGYAAGTGAVITLEDIGVWCDSDYTGPETGLMAQPFNTLKEGIDGVPIGSTQVEVHLQAGNYDEIVTITQAMVLQTENGPAIVGE